MIESSETCEVGDLIFGKLNFNFFANLNNFSLIKGFFI